MPQSSKIIRQPIHSRLETENESKIYREHSRQYFKTVKDMEKQAPKESRPPKPSRNVDYHSDWSNLEDVKYDQARSKLVDIQHPEPSTPYVNESALLRHPTTYPKILNLGRGRGKGKAPLANWTSVVKEQGHRIIIDQTPWEPEKI